MDIGAKIILHGVAGGEGQKFRGETPSEKNILQPFYGGYGKSILNGKFSCLALGVYSNGQEKFAYYTFWMRTVDRNNTISGGSYFAVTLRTIYVFKHLDSMYYMLRDSITSYFNEGFTNIEGNNKLNDNYIDSLDNTRIEELKKSIEAHLHAFNSDQDCVSLPKIINTNAGNVEFNINEFTFEEVSTRLNQGQCVFISPEFPTSEIARLNYEHQRELETSQEQIRERDKNILELNSKITKLRTQLTSEQNLKADYISLYHKEQKDKNEAVANLSSAKEKADMMDKIWKECQTLYLQQEPFNGQTNSQNSKYNGGNNTPNNCYNSDGNCRNKGKNRHGDNNGKNGNNPNNSKNNYNHSKDGSECSNNNYSTSRDADTGGNRIIGRWGGWSNRSYIIVLGCVLVVPLILLVYWGWNQLKEPGSPKTQENTVMVSDSSNSENIDSETIEENKPQIHQGVKHTKSNVLNSQDNSQKKPDAKDDKTNFMKNQSKSDPFSLNEAGGAETEQPVKTE